MSVPASVPGPEQNSVPAARADGTHGPGPQGPSPIAGWPGTDQPPAVSESSPELQPDNPDGQPPTSQKLLERASEIAGHLKTQVSELDRRENSLNSQLSQLDQERRAERLAVRQQEEALAAQAEELNTQQQQLEQRAAELSASEQEVASGVQELSARRD
ncbi:MAG: hypothetical protein VX311_02345 [Planctomycetota bacterium]|nr:hypothetical protein [Planctomycetota bacterium]